MALLIGMASFVGDFQFQFQNDTAFWNDKIEVAEQKYLVRLFGEDLFSKIKINPNDPDFAPLKVPYFIGNVESQGLHKYLISGVYCDLIIHNGTISAKSVSQIAADATTSVDAQENYSRAWNFCVDNARALRLQMLRENYAGLENYDFSFQFKKTQFLW